MDVYGVRVLVETIDDCYRCLGVVHQIYVPYPAKFKDFIANPKPNKYQSLHTSLFGPNSVPIEVQIRSYDMDRMATYGLAAHWLYKVGGEEIDQTGLIKQRWLQNLLDMWKLTGNSVEFIENVKMDLFPQSIYVFTPQGEIRELPPGSTVIDFAYAVHTDIGDSCVAARVDRHLAPLSTILSSGQTVEVITSSESKPEFSWFKFIVTGKARSKVNNYLKHQRRRQSVILGESLFQQSLMQKKLMLNHINENYLDALFEKLQCKTLDDLYEAIGLGYQDAAESADCLIDIFGKQMPEMTMDAGPEISTEFQINGAHDKGIELALCCCPVAGDKILGLMVPGKGMVVHRAECKKIVKMRQQGRMLPLKWADGVDSEFQVGLRIVVRDEVGTINKLTAILAANQIFYFRYRYENCRRRICRGHYQYMGKG